MPNINLSKSAVQKLMENPSLLAWRGKVPHCKVPYFYYFQRSYTVRDNEAASEHGDGFLLNAVDPKSISLSKGIAMQSVLTADGFDVIVAGPETLMDESFTIGWSNWKFTYEPEIVS